MNRLDCIPLLLTMALVTTGCSSIGKGITEAILEKQDQEDTRVCEIKGDKFNGIKPQLEVPKRTMKVLMVHGVGNHLPGYSTQFMEKLTKELDLTVTSKNVKNIQLADTTVPEKPLGNLRINRYLDASQTQELLFYELTWSEITAKEKEVLSYDNSGEQSFRRAEVNDLLKKFSNDTGPDPIIYLGEKREDILSAFAQSFCWMIQGDWNSLPDEVRQVCTTKNVTPFYNDSYAFVSHSLGSRITIDGLQKIAAKLGNGETASYYTALTNILKNKEIPIYMMSNQLPMLQLGRSLPEVANQSAAYCRADGAKYAERIMAKTSIIAFSDPNDLLSYAIPHDFANKYLDSRLCVNVTNININVARVYDAFGLGKLANPMDAHVGYDTDDRVIALIAKGIANPHTAETVKQRCRWTQTID
ncbi:hypothetical protein ACQE3D_15805 [Methylomonas sp. MS20]|uniref:hypothetical protein n=2 Tax=Methylomonas TaxID=416 RepID=UPI003D077660